LDNNFLSSLTLHADEIIGTMRLNLNSVNQLLIR